MSNNASGMQPKHNFISNSGPIKVKKKMSVFGFKYGNLENQIRIIFGLETVIFKAAFCFQFSIQNFRFG